MHQGPKMKWFPFLLTSALLSLSNAQVPLGNRTIQSFVDSNPFVHAEGGFARLVFPWMGGGTTDRSIWTIEDVGNGHYTIYNSLSARYASYFTTGSVDIYEIGTSTTPSQWIITPNTSPGLGNNLYTISKPLSSVPNTDIIWWTIHEATDILFADVTDDPADSFVNRLWRIV
ncbi:hypothetical protein D9756_008296 [Leucocoprinus leucothites]|uniref:Uncharacterized protein n=1 Tax=Leucocoprinus leucothites TaxID=201217 RepID=A0A8H5CZS0_9AGAR|nr:hypothetical protein D9756_008296 [Leucoagaricus leucothites]